MADLSQYTDEELMAMAGESRAPNLEHYSDEELLQAAGISKPSTAEKLASAAVQGTGKGARSLAIGAAGLGDLLQMPGRTLAGVGGAIGEGLGMENNALQRMAKTPLPSQLTQQAIDTNTNNQLQPQNMVERGADRIGQFVGGAGAMNPLAATRAVTQPLVTAGAQQATALVGAGVGAQGAEELGYGDLGQAIGGVVGGIGGAMTKNPQAIPAATSRVNDFLRKQFSPEEATASLKRVKELENIGIKAPISMAGTSEAATLTAATRARALESTNVAKNSVESLEKQITNAESSFINNLTETSRNSVSDADAFKASATSIKNAIVDARRAKANELYGQIAEKRIPPSLLKNIQTNNPIVADKLRRATNDPEIQQALFGVKPNTVEYLDRVKRLIDSDIGALKRAGKDTSPYMQAKTNLVNAVQKYVPAYKDARFAFEQDSEILSNFLGGKKGAINKIVELADQDSAKAYNAIFSLQPSQIEQVRKGFERFGQRDAFNSLTRGYLSQKLAKSAGSFEEGKTSLSRVLNNEFDRGRVVAAIGDQEKVKLFNKILEAQDEVLKNARYIKPRTNSGTEAFRQAGADITEAGQSNFGRTAGYIARQRQRITGLGNLSAKELQEISKKEEFYTELQKILFDPKTGKEWLEKYKAAAPKNRSVVIGDAIKQASEASESANLQTYLQGERHGGLEHGNIQ